MQYLCHCKMLVLITTLLLQVVSMYIGYARGQDEQQDMPVAAPLTHEPAPTNWWEQAYRNAKLGYHADKVVHGQIDHVKSVIPNVENA